MTWTVGHRTFHLGRRPDAVRPVVIAVLAALLAAGTVVALARVGVGHRSEDRSTPGSPAMPAADTRAAANVAEAGGSAATSGGTTGSGSAGAAGDTAIPVPSVQPKIVRTA